MKCEPVRVLKSAPPRRIAGEAIFLVDLGSDHCLSREDGAVVW
jgi:hypothetical protein